MYFAQRPLLPLLLIAILLVSCGGQPAATEATPDVNGTIAAGAETMVASVFQTQTAAAPTVTNTTIPTPSPLTTSSPLALPSPLPSATQAYLYFASATPTGTYYTATPNPNTLSYGCNNLLLIRSYTDPEGPFEPGEEFTQYWQVANTGTCDWLYMYELVFVSGDRLGGNGHRLSDKVPPGEWRKLSVALDAPNSGGSYTGYWRLSDGAGHMFGSTLGVSIKVEKKKNPTKTPCTGGYC